jgi:hypothetical protein
MYFKNVNKKKRTLLVLYLKDCKGELSFSFFRGKELITTGSYKATSDTLKQYSFGKIKNRINDTILYTTQIISYYKPIKDGLWKYYKNKLVNSFYYKEFVPRRKW